MVYQGVPIGTMGPGVLNPSPTGGDGFYAATTVTVDVYQTTISSGGKGSITFGGNVGISPTYKLDLKAVNDPFYASDGSCAPCLTPEVNLVVDAGANGVTFTHGLANELSPPDVQAAHLVETNYPPTFADYFGGLAANTVRLTETSNGPPTIGAPGGAAAILWVNAFTLNGVTITPVTEPAQVMFVFPQKVLVASATNMGFDSSNNPITVNWVADGFRPPASSDSSASGVAQMPLTGAGGAVGLAGNEVTPPSTIGGTPPGEPTPPPDAPNTPVGPSAFAAISTSPTVTGWDVPPAGDSANANSAPDTQVLIGGGRGVGAAADLGRNSALDGAPMDVFSAPRPASAAPCDAKRPGGCAAPANPKDLKSGAHP
jgi:hypothetical protein